MAHSQFTGELQAAVSAVVEAAKLCRKIQQSEDFAELAKRDRSPVTVADFGSQAIVCRMLHEAFPADPIIAEEDSAVLRLPDQQSLLHRVAHEVREVVSDATPENVVQWIDRGISRAAAPRCWTLDPIDGTKGFLRMEQYAIALALLIEGTVQVAALACPNLAAADSDEVGFVFSAIRGGGAQVALLSDPASTQPIHTSPFTQAAEACFCESVESGHSDHDRSADIAQNLGITRTSVRLDSQAKYSVVAWGEADIYLRLPTRPGYVEKIWDHAAGCLIVEEAGGKVTDIHGQPLDFSRGAELVNNRGIVATNGPLHDVVVDAVNQVAG